MHVVRRIQAAEARPLRLGVLRPGRPPEAVVYANDDFPETVHFGAFEDETLVGICTVQRAPDPRTGETSFQLRGMATAPEVRGRGFGAALVRAAESHVRAQGGREMWFNARIVAIGFYEKLGYQKEGAQFEVPDVGPHYLMRRRL